MITLSITFLAGRYHATPWGRHVNEGAVEWPPSPWRILRALVAVWKRTLPDLPREEVEPILRELAKSPPEFVLPPASTGHTRHYMPWFKKGPDDRTLVFDAFVVVPRDAQLLVRWRDASLDGQQQEILDRILRNLNTLGRSESWCEAQFKINESGIHTEEHISKPLDTNNSIEASEIVRLLCPDPSSAFNDDCVVTVSEKTTGRGKNKQTVEQRFTIYDPAWNLCMETLQLHKERWSDPPGSCWVQYTRPRDCFKIEPIPRIRTAASQQLRPQVVRFALDSTVLPLVTQTLPVAEALRRAVMSCHGRLTEDNGLRGRSDTLSGKNETGEPLQGHAHAYYLPTDEDGDGRIDHLTIIAHVGFDSAEMRAMDHLREIRSWNRDNATHPLRVLMLGYGRLDEYQPALLKPSRVWVSATPYIATRHAKTRGFHKMNPRSPDAVIQFLVGDLRRQLADVILSGKNIGEPVIEPLLDGDFFRLSGGRPIQFKRFRQRSGDDGGRRFTGAFRIQFSESVRGPIAVGHSSHFGMGLFLPNEDNSV